MLTDQRLTLAQAQALQPGDLVYSLISYDGKGNPKEWTVTKVVTSGHSIAVHLAYGKASDTISQDWLGCFTLDRQFAIDLLRS